MYSDLEWISAEIGFVRSVDSCVYFGICENAGVPGFQLYYIVTLGEKHRLSNPRDSRAEKARCRKWIENLNK